MSSLALLNERFLAFWAARKQSERTALTVGALAVIAALLYTFVIAPAIEGREQLQKALPPLRQQAAEMRMLAQAAAPLGDAGAAPVPAPTREAVETSLRDRGIKAQSIVVEGGIVRVQLVSAPFSTLLEWLDGTHKTAQLAVIDANIVARGAADSVDATLSLAQQKSVVE